jgi:glucan 1,3-beta-glucosidase
VDSQEYKECNLDECKPVLSENVFGSLDYPIDEWHLSDAFDDKDIATQWLNYHFQHFLKKQDLVDLKEAGITHVRVPLPHWILGDVRKNEPWIPGDRWKYFVRMCQWAREIGLEVWPNIHTAPGSQNGFDNSGIQNTVKTCGGWSDADPNIEKSLDVLHEVADRIKKDGLDDVITGFGLLNEPFGDCDKLKYQMFLDNGFEIMRSTLGDDIFLYVADLFQANLFNDGQWWLSPEYQGTYLDSHYYNIFDPYSRAMSPQEHIDEVCHPQEGMRIEDCCFMDAPEGNTEPSHGVQRIVTEWSAAFDCMPGDLLQVVMKGIQDNGVAPLMDRQLSPERQGFLTKFMQAQIVEYEKADIQGLSVGWFFWTFKTEGGAYAEWDFLRGVKEGWVPTIAPPHVASASMYGSCQEIQDSTTESMDIVHPFPWGDEPYWGVQPEPTTNHGKHILSRFDWLCILAIVAIAIAGRVIRKRCSKRRQYSSLETVEISKP